MTSEEVCPGCGSDDMKYPALSRWDNKRNVCSLCGTVEAGIPFMVLGTENPETPKVKQVLDMMQQARLWQSMGSTKAWTKWCEALKLMSEIPEWIEYKRQEAETFAKMRAEMGE